MRTKLVVRVAKTLLACALPLALGVHASPPTIEWAAILGSWDSFNIRFNEPVNPHTATNLANYRLNFGVVTNVVSFHSTNLQEYVVMLHYTNTANGFIAKVNNVQNLAEPPETISAQAAETVLLGDGIITASYFGGVNGGDPIAGSKLADLLAATNRFPNHPDLAVTSLGMESGPGLGANFGVQLMGIIRPRKTGSHTFFLSAGSQAALYLGTNNFVDAKRLIAVEPTGNGYRDYLGLANRLNTDFGNMNFPNVQLDQPVNRSDTTVGDIQLVANQPYYIEAVMKVGIGNDHLSVAWQEPGNPTPLLNGDPPIAGRHLSLFGSFGFGGDVGILGTNIPTQVIEGERVVMDVVVGGLSPTPPFWYQWFRDAQPIPDATNRVFVIERVGLADAGASFACRVRNQFSEASTDWMMTFARPSLRFVEEAGQRYLTWPAPFWDFTLQSATELSGVDAWSDLDAVGTLSASEVRVPIPADADQRFFQLRKEFTNLPPSF